MTAAATPTTNSTQGTTIITTVHNWIDWWEHTVHAGRMVCRMRTYCVISQDLSLGIYQYESIVFILTNNRWCWSVGSGCGYFCLIWNYVMGKKIMRLSFFVQKVRTNLHSVCFSWLYSIQCHIGPVDCYWRLVWTYIVCDQIVHQWITLVL